jgi:cytochrome b561
MAGRSDRYTAVAVALHWLIAIAIAAMIVIGLAMVQLIHLKGQQALGFRLFQLHKSIGITILLLGVLRLLWRLGHRPPTLPAEMPKWERGAAEATHVVLYAFLIGMPLVGWAYVSASPFTIRTVLYGLVPWPHIGFLVEMSGQAKQAVAPVLRVLHDYGSYVLIAIVAMHAGAALRHYVILHDDVLQRMVPGLPRFGARPRKG